ncbi:hypothetical protein GFS60_06023 [Rhodococcus sp. WAY2]|nr:hypothetical protein GFS60_06023 [Rhodococcus sp. WAY2]
MQGRGLTPWFRRINNNAASAGGQRALPVMIYTRSSRQRGGGFVPID